MPYYQAKKLLKNPEATLEQLLKALLDLGMEWGYIAASANHGFRDNPEADLIRIIVLSDMIVYRILKLVKNHV